ncbi:MAG TPA: hypothetical protein VN042_02590 [Asticcacaulis sp.]|nr:hypothetical protein [Asticcacaulis sp.]
MTYSEQVEADEAALKARLLRLRAFTEDIAQRLHDMPAPQTYVEATHAARALQTADKALASLPAASAPKDAANASSCAPVPGGWGAANAQRSQGDDGEGTACRDVLRACADRLLDAVERIDRPQTHIEAARAQRCALTMQALLRQLYKTPYKLTPMVYEDEHFHLYFHAWTDATGDDDRMPSDPDFRINNINCIPLPGEEDRDIWEIIEATYEEQTARDLAEDWDDWPDGTSYDPDDPFYNCPRLKLWADTYGEDYFATRSAPP